MAYQHQWSQRLERFDLLEIDGEDLRHYEWQVRRATLRSLLKKSKPGIQLSEHLEETTPKLHGASYDGGS